MTSNEVLIAGAGALGRVLYDFLLSSNMTVAAFVDDNPNLVDSTVNGVPVYSIEQAPRKLSADTPAVLAILDGRARVSVGGRLIEKGFRFMDFRMESSFVSPLAHIGKGCTLLPSSFVMTNATIGDCCHIHMFTVIGHDAVVGDFCSFAPHCTIGGGSRIDAGVTFGMGANVIPSIHIGEHSIIGAGALVTKNVPPNSVVFGAPSTIMKRRR